MQKIRFIFWGLLLFGSKFGSSLGCKELLNSIGSDRGLWLKKRRRKNEIYAMVNG